MRKLLSAILVALSIATALSCTKQPRAEVKPKWMWFDCSANWERLSYPDSIRYYVAKSHEVGMTAIVLDIKGTSGEVVYPSAYAPQKTEWKGHTRPDFDFVGLFIEEAHKRGMEIYGSFNVFAEGHGYFKRGVIYDNYPEWQATNYVPGKGMVKQLEFESKPVLFVNPIIEEVQTYEINIFKEFVARYDVDGIILDRARYDNIQSDFSPLSKERFEEYIGAQVERFPEDIYQWVEQADGNYTRLEGKLFKEWVEWRASVIYNFFKSCREQVKSVASDVKFGAYTGAWYPSYFEVGANWASNKYDASKDFSWATPSYMNYGYAELLDIYTNGNYYWNVSLEEYRQSTGRVMNETDSVISSGEHLCVEGGCIYSRMLLGDENEFLGGMYVEDYRQDAEQFKRAVKMNLEESDGLMIFDIVHIINRHWWQPLKEAIAESGY